MSVIALTATRGRRHDATAIGGLLQLPAYSVEQFGLKASGERGAAEALFSASAVGGVILEPGTSVVVMGQHDAQGLARSLIERGHSDRLVRIVDLAELDLAAG